ncbi:hypothetical protein MTO96_009716 [Rhipicephalus appendiculatus]
MGIIDVTFAEYLGTTMGLFNFLEVKDIVSRKRWGGVVLFGLMCSIGETTRMNIFLLSISYAFSFNGLHIMFCSFFSRRTLEIMSQVFYTVFYQMTAALMYVGASAKVAKESARIPVHAVVGMVTGGLHTINFLVVTYNTYIA